MRSAIIGFALGIVFLQSQAVLPPLWLLACLALTALLLACAAYKSPWRGFKFATRLLAGFVCGFAWAALLAHDYLRQELAPEWEGRDVTVIGTIDSLPSYFETGVRFNLAVEKVVQQDGQAPLIPQRLALAWYRNSGETQTPQPALMAGARWQLTVRLKRPHGSEMWNTSKFSPSSSSLGGHQHYSREPTNLLDVHFYLSLSGFVH